LLPSAEGCQEAGRQRRLAAVADARDIAHQTAGSLRITGKCRIKQLRVTLQSETLIPRRTVTNAVLQALQFAL
jgi:hypothetical protein